MMIYLMTFNRPLVKGWNGNGRKRRRWEYLVYTNLPGFNKENVHNFEKGYLNNS